MESEDRMAELSLLLRGWCSDGWRNMTRRQKTGVGGWWEDLQFWKEGGVLCAQSHKLALGVV